MKAIITTLFLLILPLFYAQNKVLFEQGNELYNAGKYAEAINKYETILKTNQHSAELYFNLANSHYKLSHVAPSVFYYEKALQLKPNDKDILNNKVFANNMTVDDNEVLPEVGLSKFIRKASAALTFDGWAVLSVVLVVVFVALILGYYFSYSTNKKRLFFLGSFVVLGFSLLSLSFSFHHYNLHKKNHPAIVFAQESQVRSEPNLRSNNVFVLHEGTKVQVLNTVSEWKQIKLTNGKIGWIISEDIKELNEI